MLLVIHGPEPYFVHRKLQQALAKARAGGTVGVTELEAGTADLKAAASALRGGSLFDDRAIVVLKNWFLEKPAEEAKELAALLETAPGETVVIIAESGEVDKRRKAFASLAKQADKTWHFAALSEPAAATWLVKRAAANEVALSPALAARLVSALGTDAWTLATELDKLTVAAEKGGITAELIDGLTSVADTATIWELVDAISARDFPKAQRSLRSLLQFGEPAQRIFAMVVRQYRILLGAKAAGSQPDAAVAKQLGVHPYSVRQARRHAAQFSEADLRTIFDDLAELDLATKTGKRDAEQALELFVAERTVA